MDCLTSPLTPTGLIAAAALPTEERELLAMVLKAEAEGDDIYTVADATTDERF